MQPKRSKKRNRRRSRFRTAQDKKVQLEQIETAQAKSRRGKIHAIIESVEKSRQRLKNSLKGIKNVEDAIREFE